MDRAYFPTFTACCAFGIIYGGEIIDEGYGAGGARLLALAARYASAIAELANLCTLVMIITLNNNASDIINKMNYAVGAGALAKTAAYTLLGIDLSNTALVDHNSITRANLSAIAIAEASEGAEAITCKVHICRLTGLGATIDILSILGTATTVTSNVGNLLNNVLSLNTENCGNFL